MVCGLIYGPQENTYVIQGNKGKKEHKSRTKILVCKGRWGKFGFQTENKPQRILSPPSVGGGGGCQYFPLQGMGKLRYFISKNLTLQTLNVKLHLE
jgi:hypothetical protein